MIRMYRNGPGLWDQIEVYDDPELYQEIEDVFEEQSIEIRLPFTKLEGLPQIIELVCGVASIATLISKIIELNKRKSKVMIRTKNNRIIEIKAENINELVLVAKENEN